MQNIVSPNVRTGKLPLRTFVVFRIIVLVAIVGTWWFTKYYYEKKIEATDKTYLRIDIALNNATHFFQSSNRVLCSSIDNKLKNPATAEKTLFWKPKADSVIWLTNNLYSFLEMIKDKLAAGNSFPEKKFISVDFFEAELYDSISQYTYALVKLIPQDRREQIPLLPLKKTMTDFDSTKRMWMQGLSDDLTVAAKLAVLSTVEVNMLASANLLFEYIDSQTENLIRYCEFYIPLINQNSTILSTGQTLEITAGIGSYTSEIKPKIIINGLEQTMNEEGFALYKLKVTTNNVGFVPVNIMFKDPNTGEIRTTSKNITYTVFQSSQK